MDINDVVKISKIIASLDLSRGNERELRLRIASQFARELGVGAVTRDTFLDSCLAPQTKRLLREGQRVRVRAHMQPDGRKLGMVLHGDDEGYKVALDDGNYETFSVDELIKV